MSTLARKKIRIAADAKKTSADALTDVYTSRTPELWRGNDVQFEIGVYFNAALITDISNIASITLEVYASTKTGSPLMTKTVEAADLDGAVTQETWDAKSAQHALVAFTAQETNFAAGTYWLAIQVITNDSPGRYITLQGGTFAVVEDAIGTALTPPTNDPLYYTGDQADARFVQKHEDAARMQWYNGCWYYYIASTGLWYPLYADIVDGAIVFVPGEGVSL